VAIAAEANGSINVSELNCLLISSQAKDVHHERHIEQSSGFHLRGL